MIDEEKVIPVQVDEKWGFVNKAKGWVVKPRFDEVCEAQEGFFRVGIGRLSAKKWTLEDIYRMPDPGPEELDEFAKNHLGEHPTLITGKYGLVDPAGRVIMEPVLDEVGSFQEGKVAARVGHNWGFIDANGEWIVKPQYENVEPFQGGVARVLVRRIWSNIRR